MIFISRSMNFVFYICSIFIGMTVLVMPIPLVDKCIHTFAWFYLVMLYAYFFDEHPPKLINMKEHIEAREREQIYIDKLLELSHASLTLMKNIQFQEDYLLVNKSIQELCWRKEQITSLTPPAKYKKRHLDILEDIEEFLFAIKEER